MSQKKILGRLRDGITRGRRLFQDFDQGSFIAYCSFYRHARPDIVSLPQHFKNHGYYTRSIGKIMHHNGLGPDNAEPQYDPISWSEPMFWPKTGIYALRPKSGRVARLERNSGMGIPKENKPLTERTNVPDDAYRDGMVATETIRTMRRVKDQPFFLAVGFYRPHTPFAAPEKYWALYDPQKITLATTRSRHAMRQGCPV